MGTQMWGAEIAEAYDAASASMFQPEVLDPAVDRLAELAGGGRALELAIGTGRVGLALRSRGIDVHGIELSPHMVGVLRAKPGGAELPVAIGDMTTTRVPGDFAVVYLVFNTIMNVTTQEEQVAVFDNAAAHLRPGGAFVVEVVVPQLRRLAPGELGRPFEMSPSHVAIETFDDVEGQISWSHHWMAVDGRLVHHAAPYRYVWPAELDLMARLAGLQRRHRWSDWHRSSFTAESRSHITVYEPAARRP
jgi:SAM-dependent methyltransferase